MSALLAPLLRPDATGTRRLRGVPRPQRRLGALPFVLSLLGILGLGMFGLLMLNTAIQDQAFQLSQLRNEDRALGEKQAALTSELQQVTSSTELRRQATELGMVPAMSLGILNLQTGEITGSPKPITGNEVGTVKTQSQADAEAKAAAERKKAEEEAARQAEEEKKKQQTPTPSPANTPPATPPASTATTQPQPTATTGGR